MSREIIQFHNPLPTWSGSYSDLSFAAEESQTDDLGHSTLESWTDEDSIEEIDRLTSQQVNLAEALELIRASKAPSELDTLELHTAYNTILNSDLVPRPQTTTSMAPSPGMTAPHIGIYKSQPSFPPSITKTATSTAPRMCVVSVPKPRSNTSHILSFRDETTHDHDKRWLQINRTRSYPSGLTASSMKKVLGMIGKLILRK
ncbi:uncharacterized protein BJ171DRAFT_84024 [Polychytrium aggregatum]|uniref:uncharacterized protein n=1 Tax=Polychytrium aggregatum TaxID=110093 RepID=UPI0022FEDC10|nr:uncharacterized protein BJ171DRAFT_482258 [Polychytrium aggregatum]XP_052967236.1 uncharacterized protein BJ171DRAFT_84024 [Polychytrium aggregatum]KAI9190706.1 hypothetical protein BJ171DRAFT_482258 [Polychytrium aggregatum]KAI9205156.1 hypothetical protein BJ171DRAFT_84024 [Polychytrium aggregatum]